MTKTFRPSPAEFEKIRQRIKAANAQASKLPPAVREGGKEAPKPSRTGGCSQKAKKTLHELKIPTEHSDQREVVRWFRATWPDVRIFAIPNGGSRSKATAGRLKAEGVSPGVPDLFIPAWRLWVEMKREKGGSLRPEQRDWITHLEALGYRCVVGKGAEDAKEKIVILSP